MNSWAESLETPSHLCPGGPGAGGRDGGTGDWHVDDLSLKPVCQALDRACFLQNSWGLARGGGEEGVQPLPVSTERKIPFCPLPPNNNLVKSN